MRLSKSHLTAVADLDREVLADLAEQGSIAKPRPPEVLQALVNRSLRAGLLLGIEGEPPNALSGYLAASVHTVYLHIDELAVKRAQRRRGIGSVLIEAAQAECVARRLKAITLTTDRLTPANIPFYEKLGFELVEMPTAPPHLLEQLAEERLIFADPSRRTAMIWSRPKARIVND